MDKKMINFTVGPVQMSKKIRDIGQREIPYFRTEEFSKIMKENEKMIFGNHDQPRIASRLGMERARALHFLNLLTPGVSVIYYGDEIGMTNGELTADDIQDNFSPAHSAIDSRDLERTPMQWDDTRFARF